MGMSITSSVPDPSQNSILLLNNVAGDSGNKAVKNYLTNVTIGPFGGGFDAFNNLDLAGTTIVNEQTRKSVTLTVWDSGATLGTGAGVYFLNLQDGVDPTTTVNLPNPASMNGREIQFVVTGGGSESFWIVAGNINTNSSASYQFGYLGSSLTLVSDGQTWWITAEYPPNISGASGTFYATDGSSNVIGVSVYNGLINNIFGT
jgi:hypothetical protein